MNNSFNLTRFRHLLKKHWLENSRRYLTGLAAYTILMFVTYYIVALSDDLGGEEFSKYAQPTIYIFSLYIGGIIYAGLMFTEYNRKETAIFNLLVPASHVEKALTLVFFGVFIFWIAITCCYLLVDASALIFLKEYQHRQLFNPFVVSRGSEFNLFTHYIIYLFLQSFFVLGSVYFRRYAFFKTTIAVTIIFLALLLTPFVGNDDKFGRPQYKIVSLAFTENDWHTDDVPYITHTSTIADFSTAGTIMIYTGIGLLLVGLWTTISFRLKEKEI